MFKILKNGKKPTRGSKFSACVDLYASEDVVIGAGETKIIGLGVAIDLEKFERITEYHQENFAFSIEQEGEEPIVAFKKSHYLQLEPRSSLRAKGLISGTGVIDMDYNKEIKIIIHKPMTFFDVMLKVFTFGVFSVDKAIKKGDKIAQITLIEHKSFLFGIESENVRDGGIGSTSE